MPRVWKCFRKLSVMLPHRFRKASELVPHCVDETPTPSAPTLDPSAAFSHLLCRGFPKTFYFALFNFALYALSAPLRGDASPMCRLGQNGSSSWPHSWLLLLAARVHAVRSCKEKLLVNMEKSLIVTFPPLPLSPPPCGQHGKATFAPA